MRLSKEAKKYLRDEMQSHLDFYRSEFMKSVKLVAIPSFAKSRIKAMISEKIKIYEEILKAVEL